jgi:hypothetical protein
MSSVGAKQFFQKFSVKLFKKIDFCLKKYNEKSIQNLRRNL